MCAEKSLTFFRGISEPAARWEIPGSGVGVPAVQQSAEDNASKHAQAGASGDGEGPTGEEIDQHAGGSPGDEAEGNAQT